MAAIASAQLPQIFRKTGVESALSVIPIARPDLFLQDESPADIADITLSDTTQAHGTDGRDGDPQHGYPPTRGYFNDASDPESRYLWRWISLSAPDLLLEIVAGDVVGWESNPAANNLGSILGAASATPTDSLLAALGDGEPSGLAPIPGLRLTATADSMEKQLERLALAIGSSPNKSPARRALDARRNRSPLEIARLLGRTYGFVLDPVIYTQGVAISGRLRLAELEREGPAADTGDTVAEIATLVEEYVTGRTTTFGAQPGGQHLAGLVWCEELLTATSDPRYLAMLLDAADRYTAGPPGTPPPPSDDNFRTEDMYFTSAVLGRAFAASGKSDYIDMAARFLADADTQKPDGLFMHCQGADWNWGRSNGFAAMGFSEALTYMPEGHELRPTLVEAHTRQLEAMLPLQQPDGTWLQVLDYPGSYHEMSVTCMVGYALARGIRLGWLDSRFRDSLGRAWTGAAERIHDDGGLVDVCTGTGVQMSTREYLDRPAEFGFDHRGGSMALWFAVEVERLRRADGEIASG